MPQGIHALRTIERDVGHSSFLLIDYIIWHDFPLRLSMAQFSPNRGKLTSARDGIQVPNLAENVKHASTLRPAQGRPFDQVQDRLSSAETERSGMILTTVR